jgi:ABC-2 type transport system ATP-binding protein
MSLVEVRDLSKHFRVPKKGEGLRGAIRHLFAPQYDERVAVAGVSFTIEPGEAVAYVGPNGAGKSTTIKMLAGILEPSGGSVRVGTFVPYRQRTEYVRHIGVVFGQRSHLWWDLPVIESLKLLKEMYGVPDAIYRQNMAFFNELLHLEELLPVPVRRLSLGQRMRADLVAALLHNPPLLFLDEPTIGLDVEVKETIRAFIRQINQERGTTIVLTSHDLGDIEDLCRRMIIIDRGRIVYDGSLAMIKQMFGHHRELRLTLHQPRQLSDEDVALLREYAIDVLATHGLQVRLRFDTEQRTAAEVLGVLMRLYDVADFELQALNLEQALRDLYRSGFDLKKAA